MPKTLKTIRASKSHFSPRIMLLGDTHDHMHGAHGIRQTNHATFVNTALFGAEGSLNRNLVVLRMVGA